MVATKPPPQEVVQHSSFPTQGDHFTPKQLQIIHELQALAGDPPKVLTARGVRRASKERKCSSLWTIEEHFDGFSNALQAARLPRWKDDPSTREQALAQYLPLKNKVERTPDAIRHADICVWYDINDGTLSNWIRKGEVRVLKRLGRGVVFVSHYDTLKNLPKLSDRLITPREAALRYGISYNTIQKLIRNGLLRLKIEPPSPGYKKGTRQIHEGDVRQYILQRIEKGETIGISIETSFLSKRRQRAHTPEEKSQPKRGICPRCNKGPQLISYVHPLTKLNICQRCYRQATWRQPTAAA